MFKLQLQETEVWQLLNVYVYKVLYSYIWKRDKLNFRP